MDGAIVVVPSPTVLKSLAMGIGVDPTFGGTASRTFLTTPTNVTSHHGVAMVEVKWEASRKKGMTFTVRSVPLGN